MDSKRTSKYSGQKLALFIFECVMAIAYLALGIVLLFTPLFIYQIPGGLRIGLGVILVSYGVFRVYRAYKKITQRNE